MLTRPLRKHSPKAEMNVVPYIDVMLVLLVIFMVTAPMLTQAVKIDLPKVAAQALGADELQAITLSVRPEGGYAWTQGSEPGPHLAADIAALREQLASVLEQAQDTPVFLRADQGVDYGAVVKVMAALQAAGIRKLGLMTEAAP
jgi:biopolymer transport protein TolR